MSGVVDIQQTNIASSATMGTYSQYYTQLLAQTLVATSPSGSWTQLELSLRTGVYYDQSTGTYIGYTDIGVTVSMYSGATPGSGTLLGTSNTVTVTDTTVRLYTFVFVTPVNYTAGSSYYFVITPSSFGSGSNVNSTIYSGAGSGYTNGYYWEYVNG